MARSIPKTSMTFRERLTTMIDPERGAKMHRERVQEERRRFAGEMLDAVKTASASGYKYHGASQTKNSLIGWITGGGSAEDDIDKQGALLRIRSRDL